MWDLFAFSGLGRANAILLACAAIALAAGCLGGYVLAGLRRAPRASRRAEQLGVFEALSTGVPAGVLLVVVDPSGLLQFASQKALAALAVPNGESWRGKSFVGLSCWDEPAEARHSLARAILKAQMGKSQQLVLTFVSNSVSKTFVFEFHAQVGTNGDARYTVITAFEMSSLLALAPDLAGRIPHTHSHSQALATRPSTVSGVTPHQGPSSYAPTMAVERESAATSRELVESMLKLLPTSKTLDESLKIVASYLARLFPATSGSLFMQKRGASGLRGVRTWGPAASDATRISSDDCWALRRSELHWVEDPEIDLSCAHTPSGRSACLPLVVRGEMVGVLVVAWTDSPPDRLLLESIAEPLASALAQAVTHFVLRDQATKDPLTGLLNRQVFEFELDRLIHRAGEDSEPASILMMDIDHFKAFNDRFGHDAGDLVLKGVASRIHQAIRATDLAFRFGGEELVVLLPCCGSDEAVVSAKRIQRLLADLTLVSRGERLPPVTISVGVATYPNDGTTSESLFRTADAGVYAAKAAGRNTVVHQVSLTAAA